jgi:hypothetical protein
MKPIYKWLIAWGILTVFTTIGGYPKEGAKAILQAPFGCALLLAIVAGIYYSKPPCPGCGRRWAGETWDHARKDGRPDLRYKKNFRRCNGCGRIRGR